MAKPRVFVSSTYYDLKHIRSSLDHFITDLGFESVLSEKGNIAYQPDIPLDESCYKEVANADILVLVIGGRYGSEASIGRTDGASRTFYDRYESITKMECRAAIDLDIPVFILVEASVHAEYQTYLRNRDTTTIKYAHVDSVNVFQFLHELRGLPHNNPVQPFERFADVKAWLTEQWAGLFREILKGRSAQKQLASLAHQVADLTEVSQTLRRYLEAVVEKISPKSAAHLIASERERLAELRELDLAKSNRLFKYLERRGLSVTDSVQMAKTATTFEKFTSLACQAVEGLDGNADAVRQTFTNPSSRAVVLGDLNALRTAIGLDLLKELLALPPSEAIEPDPADAEPGRTKQPEPDPDTPPAVDPPESKPRRRPRRPKPPEPAG